MDEAEEMNPLIKLESPATDRVLEADNGPLTERFEERVEDALEINPESKFARLPTLKVEEAESGPATCKELATVDDALEIYPPDKVATMSVVMLDKEAEEAMLNAAEEERAGEMEELLKRDNTVDVEKAFGSMKKPTGLQGR